MRTRRVRSTALAVGLALAVAGCNQAERSHGTAPTAVAPSTTLSGSAATLLGPGATTPETTVSTTPVTPAISAPATTVSVGACHARGTGEYVLPDPACTPGATNPAVTPTTITETICRSGWTATIRPPESVTEPLKRAQLARYGETGPLSAYEEDHLIPLELGGAPSDPANLWPELGASPNPKDEVESAARRAVCAGQLGLADAQLAITADWIALGGRLGVSGLPPG